jgi:3-hydroxyanthranilate 3,4-dioxygenase
MRHSPQRPVPGSIGLVVESPRQPGMKDGFEWFCMNCRGLVHRIEVAVTDIVKDLPPLYEQFYADPKARTCQACGEVHPGKVPPPGWVTM